MLAAAGILIPEGLQANGADIKGGTWFETGAEMLNGGTLNYFAVPWGVVQNPLPLAAVTLIEVVLLGAVEKFRVDGTGPAGYSPGRHNVPRVPLFLLLRRNMVKEAHAR
jgi:light-harvesting complex II chlorophyll a/b binding protein 5